MRFEISNVSDLRARSQIRELGIRDRDDVLADLRIVFSCGARTETYERKLISVPLFISETLKFLNELQERGHSVWTVYLSPIADARLEHGEVKFSWASGKNFDAHVMDCSPRSCLSEAIAKLEELASKYGKIH